MVSKINLHFREKESIFNHSKVFFGNSLEFFNRGVREARANCPNGFPVEAPLRTAGNVFLGYLIILFVYSE